MWDTLCSVGADFTVRGSFVRLGVILMAVELADGGCSAMCALWRGVIKVFKSTDRRFVKAIIC